MDLNPKHEITDGFIQSIVEELSEDEEGPLPPSAGMNPENIAFRDLYREWLNTPASSPPPDAATLFNSIAARLNISTKKRNRDKLILNDILPIHSGMIKRGLCNFLTISALIVSGSFATSGAFPVSKENVYHIRTENQETSNNTPYRFYRSKIPYSRFMPVKRDANKIKISHKPLKMNAYVRKTNEIRLQKTVKQKLNHDPWKRKG